MDIEAENSLLRNHPIYNHSFGWSVYEPFYYGKGKTWKIHLKHPVKGKKALSFAKFYKECYIGRTLLSSERVWFKDKNPLNIKLDNLEIRKKEHSKFATRRRERLRFLEAVRDHLKNNPDKDIREMARLVLRYMK